MEKSVQAKTGIKPWDQYLVFGDSLLIKSNKLSEYGLHQGCIVQLEEGPSMQIFIKGLTGKTTTIRVHRTWPARWLKLEIQQRLGISADEQRVIFSGRQLEGERTLASYNIEKEATVHVTIRLRDD